MGGYQRLIDLARKHGANKLEEESKHYCHLYERYFECTQGHYIAGIPAIHGDQIGSLLEIGVQKGGSLKMWADYIPKAVVIHGIDIKEKCKAGPEAYDPRIKVFIGDQGDPTFLKGFGEYDVIIDDGSHQMRDTIVAFQNLWSHVNPGGMYIIEDLHTSYWPEFGGSSASAHTVLYALKSLVDSVNWWGLSHKRARHHTSSSRILQWPGVHALHFHRSICFIEKGGEL